MYDTEEFEKIYSDVTRQKRRAQPFKFNQSHYNDYPEAFEVKQKKIPIQDYIDLQKDMWDNKEYGPNDLNKEDPEYIFGPWADAHEARTNNKVKRNETILQPIFYGKDNVMLNEQESFRRATYAKYMGVKEVPVDFVKDKFKPSNPYNKVKPSKKKYDTWDDLEKFGDDY